MSIIDRFKRKTELQSCAKVKGKELVPQESCSAKRGIKNDNLFFIHIHLPKTGGTTFNTVLRNNFEQNYESFEGRFVHLYPYLTNDQVSHFIEKHYGINAVSSHMFRAILPYQTSERKIISIAFVRNPVDKFFSLYFHMRHRHGVQCPEKEFLLEEYIQFKLGKTELIEGYLNQFTGVESQESLQYITELCENGHLYLFDTYNMREAVGFLIESFPGYFHNKDFEQENISIKDQIVTEEMRKKVSERVSAYDWELLKIANKVKETYEVE